MARAGKDADDPLLYYEIDLKRRLAVAGLPYPPHRGHERAVRNGSGEERRKALLRMRPTIESVHARAGKRPGRFDTEDVRLREEAVVAAAFEAGGGEGRGEAA